MRLFFKTFIAAFLAIIFFCLIIVLVFSIVASSGNDPLVVKDKTVLHLTLENQIVDRHNDSPFLFDKETFQQIHLDGLDHILKQIHKAKVDDRIEGIFIDSPGPSTGLATMQEIREALVDFKESGKWILAYNDIYSQGGYYLASVADEIYLQPEGMFELKGLRAETTFMKGLLDKMGVEVQVIRPSNNRFKSAVEPFILDSMSTANEEQLNKILSSLWDHMATDMSASRGLTRDEFESAVNTLQSRSAESAVQAGLLSGALYRDQMVLKLKERCGIDGDEDLELLSLSAYGDSKVSDYDDPSTNFLADGKVAVIYAAGAINMGDATTNGIGSDGISKLVSEARKDSSVKAIVLRVNSGGGSALASDVIWREMTLAKESKPVIVSMGDVAASGGYYIACNADKVFASENTITGSIGVFGMIPNIQELQEDKLGLKNDGVKTHPFADMMSIDRPLRADEEQLWQEAVDQIYNDFTAKVAAGRGVEQEYVNSIAQGRVWTGSDALDLKLIDAYGGLEEAIAEAASMAGLEDYRLKAYPEQLDPMQQLMKDVMGETKVDPLAMLSQEDIKLYQMVKRYQDLMKMKGVQMRMPYVLDIH